MNSIPCNFLGSSCILDEQAIIKGGQLTANTFTGRRLSISMEAAPVGSVLNNVGRFKEDVSPETGRSGIVAGFLCCKT